MQPKIINNAELERMCLENRYHTVAYINEYAKNEQGEGENSFIVHCLFDENITHN